MLSELPIDLSKVNKKNINQEVLRAGLIAELDAINLYEQMAEAATSPKIKKVLLDIAEEEKEHVGEFKTLLNMFDKEQVESDEEGQREVEEMLK